MTEEPMGGVPMNGRPSCRLWVSIDGGAPITVTLPVTVWTPSNGYHSGDYVADVAGVSLRVSGVGLFAATWQGQQRRVFATRAARVRFDFTDIGGPVVTMERAAHTF